MRIVVIAAIGRNGELGKDGKLPWHIKADLQHFKQVTDGQVVTMGRKTYETLPKKLENRTIIVLTTKAPYEIAIDDPDVIVMNTVGEIMEYAHKQNLETLYIAGGGMIYKHFLPLADAMWLTTVDQEYDADTFFEWNDTEWELSHGTMYQETETTPFINIGYYERNR